MNQLTEDDPLTESESHDEHEHSIHRYLGDTGFPPNLEVECSCGITGIVWLNGKTTWIENSHCQNCNAKFKGSSKLCRNCWLAGKIPK